ncbi:MAG: enoyl-CoA hydratase-related protein [Actinomycetota bacterium]
MNDDLDFFSYEVRRPHVAWVTIERPEVSNAIHTPAHVEWSRILDHIEQDDDIWLVVFTGRGERSFCAGRDLKHLSQVQQQGPEAVAENNAIMASITRFIDRHDFPKPTIARVNGAAHGGGFEVALACDLVVAADHVNFSLPEPKRGIYAGGGGVHRLPRQMPLKLAMEYLLTGRAMTATEAEAHGLVNAVVPTADLDAAVERLIDEIMACAPLSIMATKQAAMRGLGLPLGDALRAEYPAVRTMMTSADAKEGPLAFAERREPRWTGR